MEWLLRKVKSLIKNKIQLIYTSKEDTNIVYFYYMSTIFLQRAIFLEQKQVFLGERVRVETWPDIFLLYFKKKSVNVPSLFLKKNSSLNNWRYFRSPKTVKSAFIYPIKPSRNNQLRVPQYMSPADLQRRQILVTLPDSGSYAWFWCTGDQLQLASLKVFTFLCE